MERGKLRIHPKATCLVFCEGKDEEYFFRAFQQEYKREDPQVEGIQFMDSGGNEEIAGTMRAIIGADGFEHIRGVGIIRDAERNAEAACQSVRRILQEFFKTVPKEAFAVEPTRLNDSVYGKAQFQVGFALLPGALEAGDGLEDGTLEDLCCRIIRMDRSKESAGQELLRAIESEQGKAFLRRHKNQLHLDFSITDEYVGMKIGEAARAKAFRFEHPLMQQYGEFLRQLTEISAKD